MNKVPFDFPGHVTAEQQAASLHSALAGWDGTSSMWLFGYGSLIWNPKLPTIADHRASTWLSPPVVFVEPGQSRHARLPRARRGLDRGGSCAGVAYRLPGGTARDELERLWDREMFMGSYAPRWLDCRLSTKTEEGWLVSALAFVVRRDAQNYAGKLSEAEILAVFERGSCGRFGTSLEYLIKTVSSLRDHGLRDPHLERLARHAEAHVPKISS